MVHSVAASGTRVWAAHGTRIARVDWAAPAVAVDAEHALKSVGVSPCGKYVVGLSAGEAKTAVVLDATTLQVRATHVFAKRPSAWAIGGPDGRLFVADKFGDVFSVALLDAAAELDAHGKPQLSPVVGHVSMVLAVAATPNRVLTADRDEHIRVSELPHAYVIDKFLLGHTEYVAHLAVHGTRVLSGGGDRFVAAWDWESGAELARFDVAAALGLEADAQIDVCALAVDADTAWVAVEGVPRVVQARFPQLDRVEVLELDGPVLALAANGEGQCFAAQPAQVLELRSRQALAVGEPSDVAQYTQAHLRKTASH